LTRWAVKLSEYDYVVEHRPGSKMRHADALSRNVNLVKRDLILLRELIYEEQKKDETCMNLRQFEKIWFDKDGIIYY